VVEQAASALRIKDDDQQQKIAMSNKKKKTVKEKDFIIMGVHTSKNVVSFAFLSSSHSFIVESRLKRARVVSQTETQTSAVLTGPLDFIFCFSVDRSWWQEL